MKYKIELKNIFGITFCILAVVCMKIYPTVATTGFHIRIAYSFVCLFVGAYFLSK